MSITGEKRRARLGRALLRQVEVAVVDRFDILRHALLRYFLVVEIESCVNNESVSEDVVGAAEHVLELASNVFAEPGRLVLTLIVGGGIGSGVIVFRPVVAEGGVRVLLRHVSQAHHLVQHEPLQLLRALRVLDGRIEAGLGELDHEHHGLRQRVLLDGMPEEELAGGLHALRVVPERHLVEVHLEYLLLGVPALHLDCPPQLHELAPDGNVGPVRVQASCQLLRQRACPRDVAPGHDVEKRARHAPEAEAVMGKKIAVFPREEGVDEVARHLVKGDQLPVLVSEELRDHPVMDVEDLRGESHGAVREHLFFGDISRGGEGQPESSPQEQRGNTSGGQQSPEKGIRGGDARHKEKIRNRKPMVKARWAASRQRLDSLFIDPVHFTRSSPSFSSAFLILRLSSRI